MNFSQPLNRTGTYATKYDSCKSLYGRDDVLPMWIADMDLPVAPVIQRALEARVAHPIYGYTDIPAAYYTHFIDWQKRRNNFDIAPNQITYSTNVVFGVQMVMSMLLNDGDGVIVQPPVYFPFYNTIRRAKLTQIDNPLRLTNVDYQIDFDDLESKAKTAKALILCHPHNPIGRVWNREELTRIVDIATRHNLWILSDEIHSDLVRQKGAHIPLATLSSEAAARTITFNSPGKSFNVAGLHGSYVIFPNNDLKQQFETFAEQTSANDANAFNIIATMAAYRDGEQWFEAVFDYIKANIDYVDQFLKAHLPKVKYIMPEATYLMWLDFSAYADDLAQLDDLLLNKAKVALGKGELFSPDYALYKRLNTACSRPQLETALTRIKDALNQK